MGYVSWRMDANAIRLMSEAGLQKLGEMHGNYLTAVSVRSEAVQEALGAALQPAIHLAVANLVDTCTPEDSDAVLAYLSAALDQRTAAAVKMIDRPQTFGDGTKRQLEPTERAVRAAFTRLAALEALRKLCETGSLAPWKNAKNISVANVSAIDVGIEVLVACPACQQLGGYRLSTLDTSKSNNLFSGEFSCLSCGHGHNTIGSHAYLCRCNFCLALNRKLTADVRQLVAEESPAVLEKYRRQADYLVSRRKQPPTEEAMRRDWVLNKNDLNKALRALIELKPKDGREFLECLGEYLARHNGKRKDILEFAERRKLIYRLEQHRLPECSTYDDLMVAASWPVWRIGTYRLGDVGGSEETSRAAAKWLCGGAVDEVSAFKIEVDRRSINIRRLDEIIQLYGQQSGWFSEQVRVESETVVVLNPFFWKEKEAPDRVAAATAVRVFRSDTECNAFHRIRGERPGSIVVPNYPMKRVVDLRHLKSHFDSEDWIYLQNCEVDLVVCDEAGYVSYVEEVQRGDHHNTPEWIRKDALKRQALQLAGIPFRESF